MSPNYDTLVSSIYDCAVNPSLWPDACCQMREALDAAFVVVGFIDMTEYNQGRAKWHRRNSPWDGQWLDALDDFIPSIPNGQMFYGLDTDIAWTQLGNMAESEFRQTHFYRQWVEPQKLRDSLNVKYLVRSGLQGVLGAPTKANREPVRAAEKKLAEKLSPHIRRAVLINDLTDNIHHAQTLHRQVLDRLSVAVFVVGSGHRLVFTNASGDRMLAEGEYLRLAGGSLQARRELGQAIVLEHAVERALKGDAAVETTGIGVPLLGSNGDCAAAYVLPLAGKNLRGELGAGHCAVFVARRDEQQPMAMEILRTLFGLTVSEARVALLVAHGNRPMSIAHILGVSVHTVRTHLKHCYEKTRLPDQTALSGSINAILPPVK